MKIYLLTFTISLLFIIVKSGNSFWASPTFIPLSCKCDYTKPTNGCFRTRQQQRELPSSCLFAAAVEQVDCQTGEVINTFPSAAEAARTLGKSNYSKGISAVLRGKNKSCAGYFWRRPGDKTIPPQPKPQLREYPIEQVDIKTGEVLHIYPSIADAGRTLGCQPPCISRIVNGEADRLSYKGYYWRRVGDTSSPKQPAPPAPIKQGRQPVEQICAETGRVLATFDSISEAAQSLNISTRAIGYTLKGIQKSTRGYTFRKVGEPVPFKRCTTARPVQQICSETGDVLATYPSQLAAARAVNVTHASIHNVVTGKNAKSSGGYAWRFLPSS